MIISRFLQKATPKLFFLKDIALFLSGAVVVLKLIRTNPSVCHLQVMGFWMSHFLAVTFRELPSRFVRKAERFLWCIMEWNVQTAELSVDAFFRNSPQNLTEGMPASGMCSREGTGGSLPWQFCDRRDGGLQGGGGGWLINCWHHWNMGNSAAHVWSLGCLYQRFLLTHAFQWRDGFHLPWGKQEFILPV